MGRMASFPLKICEKSFLPVFMIHSSLAKVLGVVKPGVGVGEELWCSTLDRLVSGPRNDKITAILKSLEQLIVPNTNSFSFLLKTER